MGKRTGRKNKKLVMTLILIIGIAVILSFVFYYTKEKNTTLKEKAPLKEGDTMQESYFSHLIGGMLTPSHFEYDYNASESYEIDNQYISGGLEIECGEFDWNNDPCSSRGMNPAILYGDVNNKTYENLTVRFYAKKDRTDYNYSLKIGACNDESFNNYFCFNKKDEVRFNLSTSFQWYEINISSGKNYQPTIYLELNQDEIPSTASGSFYVYIDKVIILGKPNRN